VFKSEPINFLKVLLCSTFKKFIGFAALCAATLFLCLSLCGDSYIPILEIVVILSRIKNQHKEGF